MELFFTDEIDGNICRLGQEESGHCIKVLRHRSGDEISVTDGNGCLYRCRISDDSPKNVSAEILECTENWGSHPYALHMAVAPTKNTDRYEWFMEKACEVGVDIISPVIGNHSERKIFKTARAGKILISASKQSLKGKVPTIKEPVSVSEFIRQYGDCGKLEGNDDKVLRLIAYCFEDEAHPKTSIKSALAEYSGKEIIIMIGPEGDFSKEEAELAFKHGFIPVHLGDSRLRTETAAVTAVNAVYFRYMH